MSSLDGQDRGNYWTRRRLSRRGVLGAASAAAVGASGLMLVGCGDDDDDDDDNGATPGGGGDETPQPTTEPSGETPQSGGTLVWGTNADANPASLPAYSSSVWLFPIQYGVFDYLAKYDGFTLDVKPYLAESWEQPSDTEMVLKLREGVTWHNGDPFTADDVIFNLGAIAEGRSRVGPYATMLTADATDEHTVTLTFQEPLPGVFDLFNYMYLAHPGTFDQMGSAEQIIGAGPFKFVEWIPGEHVLLEKNPDYWQEGKPYVDQIDWKLFPQANMASAMEAGEIDYTANLEITEAIRLGNSDGFNLVPGSTGYSFLYFRTNVEHPVLGDKRIRQAMNFAIDRERIAEEVMGGLADPMTLFWPDYSPAYDAELASTVTFDLDKAKALLDEAGYSSDAESVPLTFSAALTATEGIMTVVQNDLQSIGMNVHLDKLESSVFIENFINHTLPGAFSFLLGYAGMYPTTFLIGIQPPQQDHYNAPGYEEKMADFFERGNVESTLKESMSEFSELMIDEAFMVPVVPNLQPHVLSKDVGGFNVNVVDDIRMEELWLSQG